MSAIKTLRNGKTIKFTRSNPTTTINAIRRDCIKKGIDYEYNEARTGSRYIDFIVENLGVTIRAANHTKANGDRAFHQPFLVNGLFDSFSLDLSLAEWMGAQEIRALIAEGVNLNAVGIDKADAQDFPILSELGWFGRLKEMMTLWTTTGRTW